MKGDNSRTIASEIIIVWSKKSQVAILVLKANILPKFRFTISTTI